MLTLRPYVTFSCHPHLQREFDCLMLLTQLSHVWPWKIRRKETSRCKPSKVTVIVVEDLRKGLPKGKYRKELTQSQRAVSLEFYRYMSSTQIKNAIIRGFKHLPLHCFKYLVCDSNVSLVVNADQDQDGNKIINSLQPGKGTLYLLKCQEVSITIHLLYNSSYYCVAGFE